MGWKRVNIQILRLAQEVLYNGPILWYDDYEAALARAEKRKGYHVPHLGGGLVFALVTKSAGCPGSRVLRNEVLSKEEFRVWFNARWMVPFQIDASSTPRSPEIKAQWQEFVNQFFEDVITFPTVLILEVNATCAGGMCSYTGQEKGGNGNGRLHGPADVKLFIEEVKKKAGIT